MATADPSPDEARAGKIVAALEQQAVPDVYANGFTVGLTNGDIVVVLERNGLPVTVVNMSFTISKTLVEKLGELVARLESTSKHDIMTTAQLDRALQLINQPASQGVQAKKKGSKKKPAKKTS